MQLVIQKATQKREKKIDQPSMGLVHEHIIVRKSIIIYSIIKKKKKKEKLKFFFSTS
jgi:hypothetical protein